MSDRVFALLAALSGGFFGLAVAVVTGWLTSRREGRTFKRQFSRDRVEAVRALYEDALFSIETLIVHRGRGTEEGQANHSRIFARLALNSTDEIRTQFGVTTAAAQAWGAQQRQAEPRESGGLLFYVSGVQKYADEAEKLYPAFRDNLHKLRTMMVEHLQLLESRIK